VKRLLIRSNAFVRDAKRLAKKDAQAVEQLLAALALLGNDAYEPRLKTHKLKGDLLGSWACSFMTSESSSSLLRMKGKRRFFYNPSAHMMRSIDFIGPINETNLSRGLSWRRHVET
jgi:hypothetical protein